MAMWKCAVSAAILLLALTSVQSRVPDSLEEDVKKLLTNSGSKVEPTINIACVLEHCTLQSASCLLSGDCRSVIGCAQTCMNQWDDDTTPEKFHVQNCTNKCAFTYNGEVYDKFMSCLSDHKCIAFPPIPNTCRAPNVHPLKSLSLKDIQGSWWVVKGYHPVYDCFPCQLIKFEPINATAWNYLPKYEVYLVNGSLLLVSQNVVMPYAQRGKNISFVYHNVGLEHFETWWLIDQADDRSYTLMYYCGNTLQWYYEGAMVLARNRTLSDEAYKKIAVSYKAAVGLNTADFCDTRASLSCPD